MVDMSELSKASRHAEDLQDPGEAQGAVEVQLLGAEVREAASSLASSALQEGSHSARYEFLWGPCAYLKTSKWQVMAFVLKVRQRALRAFPPLSAEAAREEEEGA